MSDNTKQMVREWVAKDGGDTERTARWMARTLKLASVKECREMITEAIEN